LKRERWGSLLVQEKYREEMPVTETSISYNNNNNNNNNNTSITERKIEEGIKQEIKNDTEIRVECQL